MDSAIFGQKDLLPSLAANKLAAITIDYKENYHRIKTSRTNASPERAAGVVLLLTYKKFSDGKSEYVFQLIKRSDKVSQAGDISCPGGMLHPIMDGVLSRILAKRLISTMPQNSQSFMQRNDRETRYLIRLFLINALREAWEEIGLNPLKVMFLGSLPCYSLLLFTRTIFPLVCLNTEASKSKLSAEVEKILEVPVSTFFDSSSYALLEIETPLADAAATPNKQFPCIVLADNEGRQEILWGATFNIITNFLNVISDNNLPFPSSSTIIKKVLSAKYISGSNR